MASAVSPFPESRTSASSRPLSTFLSVQVAMALPTCTPSARALSLNGRSAGARRACVPARFRVPAQIPSRPSSKVTSSSFTTSVARRSVTFCLRAVASPTRSEHRPDRPA